MRLHSQVEPVYLPDPQQQTVLRLGLQTLPIAEWLNIDADYPQFRQHKDQQQKLHSHKVFAQTQGSQKAQLEFAEYLKDHLLRHHRNSFALQKNEQLELPDGSVVSAKPETLWQSALWIQDDICLLEEKNHEYRMTAASLCAPSNWKLEDKIGQTLDWIHEPVPGYQQQLAQRVNKLMSGLKPGKPLLRYNWSIQNSNELCWRDDLAIQETEEYYWRVERQTLIKLPQTGAIVFAIRLFLHSFETMNQRCDFNNNLAAILARLPPAILQYKALDEALFERLQGKQ